MPLNMEIYERTIVFVQRAIPQGFESFAKYAELELLLKKGIFDYKDFENVDFGEDQGPMQKSISFSDKNIKIVGQIDRLIISMLDPNDSDKYFYEVSNKFSDSLVKENISAIGVNFNGIIETKKADEIIKDKIINESPTIMNDADSASFKLVYKDLDNKALSIIGIDAGGIRSASSKEKKEGILISYNYHRDIKTQQLMKDSMNKFQDSLEKVKVKFEEYKTKLEGFLNG